MAQLYADRGFLSVNGAFLEDVKTAVVRRNPNAKVVSTMTRNGRNKGYVQGNLDITVDFTIAVENQLARPKLESINYEANNVALTFEVGADLFTVTGLFPGPYDDNAPGTGQDVTTSFSFGALDVVDAIGNSSLFDLVLAA